MGGLAKGHRPERAKADRSASLRPPLLPSSKTGLNWRWFCGMCQKSLCSKRSYKEHMNTHTNSRPYQCESCPYAAGSILALSSC